MYLPEDQSNNIPHAVRIEVLSQGVHRQRREIENVQVRSRCGHQIVNFLRDLSKREKIFESIYTLENVDEHFGW